MTLTTGHPVVPAPNPGRHRHRTSRPVAGLIGLAVALAAAGALIALSPGGGSEPAGSPQVRTVAQAWPDAQRADVPGGMPDGPTYTPAYFLDAKTSLGTAPDPGGTMLRLVLRGADGAVRELRRLPISASPQYGGFVKAGDEIAWAESMADDSGTGKTRMWITNLTSDSPPRQLTANTGDVVFFNSQYDMVIDNGRLYWVAVAPTKEPATEVRSVPLTGGDVTVRTETGAWALSGWPWLVSAGTGQSGPVQLRNLDARQVFTVDAAATELVTCSPTWCRVLVLAGEGPARIDLMRPDGADRQRVAGGSATASIIDVAVLDRFEVLSQSSDQSSATSSQQLLLYDVKTKQIVVVADGVGMVLCRGNVLWWSTGDNETIAWHTLDLRTLT